MKLIEKECPNCGASLSFTEKDKSCRCEYCKREFEIERDSNKAKSLVDQFDLTPIKSAAKIFSIFTLGSFISSFIIFLVVAGIIITLFLSIITKASRQSIFNEENTLITEEEELSVRDYDALDLNSKITIMKNNDTLGDYSLKGTPKREKLYIISRDNKNTIIPVYKTTYRNLFETDHVYTIYVPVTYKNVKTKNNSIAYSLGRGTIDAPEYYFNLEHSDYAYGYQELDALNTDILNKYNGYKIEEK